MVMHRTLLGRAEDRERDFSASGIVLHICVEIERSKESVSASGLARIEQSYRTTAGRRTPYWTQGSKSQ